MVMRTEKFNYKWEGDSLGSETETDTGAPGCMRRAPAGEARRRT